MQCLLQTLLLGCALLLASWVQLPAAALAGLGLAAAALVSSALAPQSARAWMEGADLAVLWIGSLTVWITVALANIGWDFYYAALAGLMAAAIWLKSRRAISRIWKARWNAAVMAWLLCGAFVWLGAGYFQNQRGVFYAGLLATVAVLVLCRLWFAWGAIGTQTVNTLILLLVGLPVVDLALRPQSRVAIRPGSLRALGGILHVAVRPPLAGGVHESPESRFSLSPAAWKPRDDGELSHLDQQPRIPRPGNFRHQGRRLSNRGPGRIHHFWHDN
jgi:hypothetical protein